MNTSAGKDWMLETLLSNTRDPAANVVALSEATVATDPSAWTKLGGAPGNELATDGLGRQVASYGITAGQGVATLSASFTHNGGAASPAYTIRSVGVFSPAAADVAGAADTGRLVLVLSEPDPPVLVDGDTLSQQVAFSA